MEKEEARAWTIGNSPILVGRFTCGFENIRVRGGEGHIFVDELGGADIVGHPATNG